MAKEKVVENCVYLCVFANYLLFITENWVGNWKYVTGGSDLKEYRLRLMKSFEKSCKRVDYPDFKCASRSEVNSKMEGFCRHINSAMFQLVAAVKLADIKNVKVHKNKDPSVDITFFKGQYEAKANLLFTSDMQR